MINHFNFILLRTPLLPFIINYDRDLDLKKIFSDPLLQEALYLASPVFFTEVQKYINGNISEPSKIEKIESSLYKYYMRMSFRCTPYGLFSGVSTLKFASATNIQLSPTKENKGYTRLDFELNESIFNGLMKINEVKLKLRFYPNNTIYDVGPHIRFIESCSLENSRKYDLVKIDNQQYLKVILESSKLGLTISELSSLIVSEEIDLTVATNFIDELINSKILISEIEPQITGGSYICLIQQTLQRILKESYCYEIDSIFQNCTNLIDSLDKLNNGYITFRNNNLHSLINELPGQFKPINLFQVDLFKPAIHNCLSELVFDEIKNAGILLYNIFSSSHSQSMQQFREAFYVRYEHEEVPLTLVMDDELGLGYPINKHQSDFSSIINNFAFPNSSPSPLSYPITPFYRFLIDEYIEAIKNNKQEIVLTESSIKPFLNKFQIPHSLLALCSIFSPSCSEVDKGNFQLDFTGFLTHGGRFISRFSHTTPVIDEVTKKVFDFEKDADSEIIFAEIVHLPESRAGNILLRPIISDFEIPIYTPSTLDPFHTITLDDLLISHNGEKLILRSKKHNKVVIPRLTSAHNFSKNSLPIYNFLCELQFQDVGECVLWNWGMLENYEFLPRVSIGKTILQKAKWKLKYNSNYTDDQLICHINSFLVKNDVPRFITISQGDDNLLPLDSSSGQCIKIICNEIKKYGQVIIMECLYNKDNVLIKNEEGSFTNELIIPLKNDIPKKSSNDIVINSDKLDLKRCFTPGSDFIYFKLYCSPKTADKILINIIKPFVERLLSNNDIQKWFFIRYTDPSFHLRIRVLKNPSSNVDIIKEFNDFFSSRFEARYINKVQLDTYIREIERYGINSIEQSEDLFFLDSVCVVSLIDLLNSLGDSHNVRWLSGMKGVDVLFDDFSFSLEDRLRIVSELTKGLLIEFECNKLDFKKQLSNNYRLHKNSIKLILTNGAVYSGLINNIFIERSEKIKILKFPKVHKENLIKNFIHMFLNRLLKSNPRHQELVIYDFLNQYYKSLNAKYLNEFRKH